MVGESDFIGIYEVFLESPDGFFGIREGVGGGYGDDVTCLFIVYSDGEHEEAGVARRPLYFNKGEAFFLFFIPSFLEEGFIKVG